MGAPYSKEIEQALDKATPLVATAQQVLEQTKYLAAALLVLQIVSTVIVGLILVCLLALLITLNPDLEDERRAMVTPAVRRATRVLRWWWWWCSLVATVVALVGVGVLAGWAVPVVGVAGFVAWVAYVEVVPAGGRVAGEGVKAGQERGRGRGRWQGDEVADDRYTQEWTTKAREL